MNDRIIVLDDTTYNALRDVLDYILDTEGDDDGLSPLEVKAGLVAQALADQDESNDLVRDGLDE